MAAIRFIDAWLRCPGAVPTQVRSTMVISEKWAEQRVLMRAYSESRDQTRPVIRLHGAELAIGPASTDVNGPWGIHIGDSGEGGAQVIKHAFEEAARRLAGSKGNPPRLLDESQTFDREPTGNWIPGTPRVLPQRPDPRAPAVDHVAPAVAARIPQAQVATIVPHRAMPAHGAVMPPSNPELRITPMPRARGGRPRPPRSAHTALGYSSGAGAQSAIVRLGLAPGVSATLGRYQDRVVPAEFHIDARERRVLNALGEYEHMTARAIGQSLDVADAVAFMEDLVKNLEAYGLGDLVEPGPPVGGEPTYRLRR
jgi:hypothetical protein